MLRSGRETQNRISVCRGASQANDGGCVARFTAALHRFLGLRLTDLQRRALMAQVDLSFTKETSVSFIRHFSRIGVALMVGLSLSGCVIRPLWWGDGHRHGEHREYGADYGRAPSDGHSRYDSERGR